MIQVQLVDANGEALRKLRTFKGYSLRDLEKVSGVTQDNIWKIENGKTRRPHGKTMRSLAEALGVEVEVLYKHDDRS